MPEQAIVEWNDHASRQDPEIAGMRVGMEEAELENLLEQDASAGDGDFLRRRLQQADAVDVVDWNPFDKLHGQDARSRQLGKG